MPIIRLQCFVIDLFLGGKNDRYQTVLKQVHLSLVSHDTCQKQLRDTRLGDFFILDESFICAGGIRGEDVCKVSETKNV